jgi:hypothetical protein
MQQNNHVLSEENVQAVYNMVGGAEKILSEIAEED